MNFLQTFVVLISAARSLKPTAKFKNIAFKNSADPISNKLQYHSTAFQHRAYSRDGTFVENPNNKIAASNKQKYLAAFKLTILLSAAAFISLFVFPFLSIGELYKLVYEAEPENKNNQNQSNILVESGKISINIVTKTPKLISQAVTNIVKALKQESLFADLIEQIKQSSNSKGNPHEPSAFVKSVKNFKIFTSNKVEQIKNLIGNNFEKLAQNPQLVMLLKTINEKPFENKEPPKGLSLIKDKEVAEIGIEEVSEINKMKVVGEDSTINTGNTSSK